MSDWNPDEAKRLADEMGEDDERAIDGQWSVDHGPDADVLLDGNGFAVCSIEHDANSTAAIARLRNNARSASTQLRAAVEEVERLRALADLGASNSGRIDDALATTARDAIADRDRLAGECESLRAMFKQAKEDHDSYQVAIHALTADLARYRAIVEERDAEVQRLRQLVQQVCVRMHIVGANGGMTDADHRWEGEVLTTLTQPAKESIAERRAAHGLPTLTAEQRAANLAEFGIESPAKESDE